METAPASSAVRGVAASSARPARLRVPCADGRVAHVWMVGEGRPLLLLHDWGIDGHVYRKAMRGLAAAGFRVVAPTMNVAMGAGWSLSGLAQRAAAVCDAVGIQDCPVVGHSFGGVVAARFALDFPSRASALVVVNSALVSPGAMHLCSLALPGPHYRLALDPTVLAAFVRAHRSPATFAHLAGSVRWMLSTDLSRELPKLRERHLPSAVLWALETCLPESLGRRAAELLGASFHAIAPNARARGASLDHIWPLRSPEMFVERVVAVLETIGASR